MNKKGLPYRSPDHSRYTMACLGQGDERSENGMFEDPLCGSLDIHMGRDGHLCERGIASAWMVPVHADAAIYPLGNFWTDATMR
jgi:hypothetical protein